MFQGVESHRLITVWCLMAPLSAASHGYCKPSSSQSHSVETRPFPRPLYLKHSVTPSKFHELLNIKILKVHETRLENKTAKAWYNPVLQPNWHVFMIVSGTRQFMCICQTMICGQNLDNHDELLTSANLVRHICRERWVAKTAVMRISLHPNCPID